MNPNEWSPGLADETKEKKTSPSRTRVSHRLIANVFHDAAKNWQQHPTPPTLFMSPGLEENWGPPVPGIVTEKPTRLSQINYAGKNVIRTVPGRLKSESRASTVATPTTASLSVYITTATSKRMKTNPDENLCDSLLEKSIGPEPTGDPVAAAKWKKDRAQLRAQASRNLKDGHYGFKIYCMYDQASLADSRIFEIVVPYNIMAVLLGTFKSPDNLHHLRRRCTQISGVTKCIYYPLFKDLLTWEDNDLLDQSIVIELSAFFERIAATLKELTGQDYLIMPLYLETVEADHQKPHLDDDRATSREKSY